MFYEDGSRDTENETHDTDIHALALQGKRVSVITLVICA